MIFFTTITRQNEKKLWLVGIRLGMGEVTTTISSHVESADVNMMKQFKKKENKNKF